MKPETPETPETTYYIYEAHNLKGRKGPRSKIGCTKYMKRVNDQLGVVLCQTTDEIKASLIERTAQFVFGYAVDSIPYHEMKKHVHSG